MTDGCGMGNKSMSKFMNQHEAADEASKDLAKRLVSMEDHLVRQIRPYPEGPVSKANSFRGNKPFASKDCKVFGANGLYFALLSDKIMFVCDETNVLIINQMKHRGFRHGRLSD